MTREICIDITSTSGCRSNYTYPLDMLTTIECDNIVNKAITAHKEMAPKEDMSESFMAYIRAAEFTNSAINRLKTFTIYELDLAIKFLQEDDTNE